jgi:hypothetical protein
MILDPDSLDSIAARFRKMKRYQNRLPPGDRITQQFRAIRCDKISRISNSTGTAAAVDPNFL